MAIPEIQYQGKTYIDLNTLTERVQFVYPWKTHNLRRLAKLSKIPSRRIAFNNKLWFCFDEVVAALHHAEINNAQNSGEASEAKTIAKTEEEIPQKQIATQTEGAKTEASTLGIPEVRKAANALTLAAMGADKPLSYGRAEIKRILSEFGVEKIEQLQESDYANVIDAFEFARQSYIEQSCQAF